MRYRGTGHWPGNTSGDSSSRSVESWTRSGGEAMRIRVAFCAVLVLATVSIGGSLSATAQTAPIDAGAPVAGDPNLGVLNQGTRTTSFDDGWKFKLVNTNDATDPSGIDGNSSDPLAAAVNFDDSAWQAVTLPHDWSITHVPQPTPHNAPRPFPAA